MAPFEARCRARLRGILLSSATNRETLGLDYRTPSSRVLTSLCLTCRNGRILAVTVLVAGWMLDLNVV